MSFRGKGVVSNDRTYELVEKISQYREDRGLDVPVYYQIAYMIRMVADELAPIGENEWILLPSKKSLAELYDIATGTLVKTYDMLSRWDVIERRRGYGVMLKRGYTHAKNVDQW